VVAETNHSEAHGFYRSTGMACLCSSWHQLGWLEDWELESDDNCLFSCLLGWKYLGGVATSEASTALFSILIRSIQHGGLRVAGLVSGSQRTMF
jgi:hypothetical protein